VLNDLLTFTIITVPANESLSPLHDRMPAIVSRESAVEWLNTGDLALFHPTTQPLAIWPVSSRVNSPANNDIMLTEDISAESPRPAPNTAEDQSGNKVDQLTLAL
jgi:putative SOS response-associated peptidase YedK